MFKAKALGVDLPYKTALTEESRARRDAALEPDPLDKTFITHPVLGDMTGRNWKMLTSDQREYTLYAHKTVQEGKTPMSERDFKMLDPTTKEKFLRALQRDPKLKDLAIEMAEASGIDIFGSLEVAKGKGELKIEQYFAGGEWAEDANKYIESTEAMRQYAIIDDPVEKSKKKVRLMANRIEQQITSRGAKILDVRMEGNVRIWKIQFANKNIREIPYDFGQLGR